MFSITSWQTVGCATPGNPSHIPSQPAIGQKVLVLSTATSATEQMSNEHELYFPSELNIPPPQAKPFNGCQRQFTNRIYEDFISCTDYFGIHYYWILRLEKDPV